MDTNTNEKLQDIVEQEIQGHGKTWCSHGCDTFLPETYRKARITHGRDAEAVQGDYDQCHIFR